MVVRVIRVIRVIKVSRVIQVIMVIWVIGVIRVIWVIGLIRVITSSHSALASSGRLTLLNMGATSDEDRVISHEEVSVPDVTVAVTCTIRCY